MKMYNISGYEVKVIRGILNNATGRPRELTLGSEQTKYGYVTLKMSMKDDNHIFYVTYDYPEGKTTVEYQSALAAACAFADRVRSEL